MSFQAGDVIGDYEVVGNLGAGGMGEVYKVRNTLSDRVEAMKVLLPQSVGSPEQAERFLREIRLQAALDHPNIAALRTALRHGDQFVMIVELVEGTSLQALLEQRPLTIPEAASYFAQALAGLEYAHSKGVIHRDIKPGNILLSRNGTVKLSDFGIARLAQSAGNDRKLTVSGTTMGSIYYMSPEQVTASSELDFRSDIYSLGITLYESVTGKRPFQADAEYAILSAHVNQAPVPPSELDPAIPPELDQVILKAMAKQPSDRFPSAAAFREALLKVPGASQQASTPQPLSTGEITPRETVVLPATPRPSGSRTATKGEMEMAYVLFMDIVGYSKLKMDQQSERIQSLVEIVRNTAAYQRAHQSNQIISLPTGDGMALVFFQNLMLPVQCAMEVARVLKSRPDMPLRMGVNTGPVYRIADINTNLNVAGGGINMAQRVMDCGDSGHILLSKRVADDLGELSDWAGHLTDLGECEVKHGVKVHLVNLFTGEVGNPELPAKVAKAKGVAVAEAPPPVEMSAAPQPAASHQPAAKRAAPSPSTSSQPVPAAVSSGSNRTLFVTVGALAAVLVIGFAAMQLFKGGASPVSNEAPASATPPAVNSATIAPTEPAPPSTPDAPASTTPPPPSTPVATTPPATPLPPGSGGPAPAAAVPAPSSQPASAASSAPASAPAPVPAAAASTPAPAPAPAAAPTPAPQPPQQAAAPAPPAANAADLALLQEQQERMIDVASRAAAVRSSFEAMEEQQRRSGLGMRRDMAAAAIRLKFLLEQSGAALSTRDAPGAKRNLDMAEQNLGQLERFLGR